MKSFLLLSVFGILCLAAFTAARPIQEDEDEDLGEESEDGYAEEDQVDFGEDEIEAGGNGDCITVEDSDYNGSNYEEDGYEEEESAYENPDPEAELEVVEAEEGAEEEIEEVEEIQNPEERKRRDMDAETSEDDDEEDDEKPSYDFGEESPFDPTYGMALSRLAQPENDQDEE